MPKISVIVPVYKAEKYIERCITSVLNQTFRDFELLLIDDGSPDCSGSICDRYAIEDERIKVIHKENTGVSDTRNVGLREARGKYISFVDSDDYIAANMLEELYKCATVENSDIVMCKYYIDNNGKISLADMDYEERYNTPNEVIKKLLYRYYTDNHEGLYSLCNKLIRRELFVNNNIWFDIKRKRGEDAWFVFQCLKYAKKVMYIPKAFYYYYQSQNSIMHKVYKKQYDNWVSSRKELLLENQRLGFDIDYILFYKEFLYKVSVYCRNLAELGEKQHLAKILKDPFYKEALTYMHGLPLHIKLLGKLILKGRIKIVMLLYKLWTLK